MRGNDCGSAALVRGKPGIVVGGGAGRILCTFGLAHVSTFCCASGREISCIGAIASSVDTDSGIVFFGAIRGSVSGIGGSGRPFTDGFLHVETTLGIALEASPRRIFTMDEGGFGGGGGWSVARRLARGDSILPCGKVIDFTAASDGGPKLKRFPGMVGLFGCSMREKGVLGSL